MPKWFGPPDDVLGGDVGRHLVLGRTESVAVVVSRLVGYPLGYTIDLLVVGRTEDTEVPDLMGHARMRRGAPPGMPEDAFRFGVLMSDGSRAVNDAPPSSSMAMLRDDLDRLAALDRPPEPILQPRGGGGGGGRRWDWRFWAAPLPPSGPVRFYVQWLAAGLEETCAEINAREILDAAGRAAPIWT